MRLAIVGASVRAAACSALDAGYDVAAADLFADSDLAARCPVTRMPPEPEAFVRWLAEQDVDGWMYTGSWENYPDQVDAMAALRPLMGNSGQVLRQSRSIERLTRACGAADVAFPETRTTPPDERGWLAKSTTSAGGLGIDDWQPGTAADPQRYYQRKIEGRPISAAYVAAGGGAVLLGVTEQLINRPWTRSQPYHYAGSIGPITGTFVPQLIHAGQVLARELGLVGLLGVDFVVDTGGTAWLVDVNPRYTASMEIVERFATQSIAAAHTEACLEGRLRKPWHPTGGYCGKAYVFAKRTVRFRRPPGVQLADLPAEGTTIARGKPICTVLAEAGQLSEVEAQLADSVGLVERQLYRTTHP